ncbi:MAG: archaeosine synthase subunit alpha, partial [Methanomicrobiales archaeon]|nr:archaeosine synthase subunit alpha [Methanomicrobiales archaeon]
MRRCRLSLFDIRRRDCLAREGIFSHGDLEVRTPGIIDMQRISPALDSEAWTNVPLAASAGFVSRYQRSGTGSPVVVHPLGKGPVISGDLVVVANWHTVLARPPDFVRYLAALKGRIPPDTAWFAPASALPSTAALLVYAGFDLFDHRAVDLETAKGSFCLPEGIFPGNLAVSGVCTCEGCTGGDIGRHNRLALERELALARRFITESRLRELVEARCRSDPHQVAIMRLLDGEEALLEPWTPVARSTPFIATTSESLRRIEVRRWGKRVVERSPSPIHEVAVLLPCSARKPYSTSLSHHKFTRAVSGRAHELIVTSPLGLVPRELERVYPAGHYDVPVTGYWDREELALISSVIAGYLGRHHYRRVLAHLDGGALEAAWMAADACGIPLEVTAAGHPTDPASLAALDSALEGARRRPNDMVRGILAWQFGVTVETRGMVIRGRPPQERVEKGGRILFTIDARTGLLRPTFEGWALIPDGYRVGIDTFTPKGDILAPGIISADEGIREGDEVLVLGEGLSATGRAAMGGPEMLRSRHGVAVRVRK